jgi:hypothetical protein
MWKKIISLFLVICLLTTVVGCGGGGVTPPINDDNDDNDYSEISEEFIEEEKTFMVTAEEGGIFELSDRSRVEIPPNSLSRDATLYIAKINLELQDTSDFNGEIFYEVKIIERTVQILQPFILFLPIPLGIDTSNIAVLRFDNDSYELIEGNVGLKSIDRFVSIEEEEMGYFKTVSAISTPIQIVKTTYNIISVYNKAKGYYKANNYDDLYLLLKEAEKKEDEAYDKVLDTPGVTQEEGEEILNDYFSFETLADDIAGDLIPIYGIFSTIKGAIENTIKVIELSFKIAEAIDVLIEYAGRNFELKIVSSYYNKIGLDVWADVVTYPDSGRSGPAPLKVSCTGAVEEGIKKPFTYYWDFGNEDKSEIYTSYNHVKSLDYIYEEPGKYMPILYVEDNGGRKGQAEGGKITVTPPDPFIPDKVVERIEVLPSSMTIKKGSSQSISSIKAYYSDDTTKSVSLSDPGLFYSNLSPFIASVDNGKITGEEEGKVIIRVFYNDGKNVYDDVEVTVIPDKVLDRIDVLPSSMTIKKGSSQSISSIKAYYLGGSTKSVSLSDSGLAYESLNPSVATVSYGKITAKEAGTATIKVYYQDKGVATDKVAVTVPPPSTKVLERISVSPASMSLGQGDYQYISSITAYYSDNSSANIFLGNPNLDYDSLNPGVADVYDNGKVTAIKPGSATIKVYYTDKVTVEDTVVVTVGGGIDPPEWVDASIGASIWIYIWWDSVNGATHYQLYRATSPTGKKTILSDWQTDTSFTDYDVNEGIKYYYFVKAATSSTGANASTYSSYYIGFTIPPAPTGVSASQGTSMNSVYIIWNSASLATHYQVYRATSSTGTKAPISDWQTDTSFTDDDVIQGTTYYYFVKAAYYDSGSYYDSAYSSYGKFEVPVGDNSPPVITSLTANPLYVDTNQTSTITCNAYDPDGDPLTYYWTKTGGIITGSGSTATWIAPSTKGTYTVSCTVNDGKGGEDSESVSILVGGNHPPVISNINAPSSVETNETTTITCNASDPDGDSLTYYWTKTGGIITGSGSTVTWKAPSTKGIYTVSCEVSDGEASDSKSVNISVGDNHAPVITSDPITTATVDEPYHYDVNATDPDGDTLTYSFARPEPYRPAGTIINPSTGLFTWTPQNDGVYDFIVKVEDDGSPVLSDTQSFEITVAPNTDPDPEALDPPTGVSASDGTYTDHVKISWNSVTGASHYQVYRATSSGGTKTLIIDWANSTHNYDYSVTPGTTYYYWVKAAGDWTGAYASDYSDYDTGYAYDPGPSLSPPTGVSVSNGNWIRIYAYITWNSVPGATHYKVYRATSSGGTKTAITSWIMETDYLDQTLSQVVV